MLKFTTVERFLCGLSLSMMKQKNRDIKQIKSETSVPFISVLFVLNNVLKLHGCLVFQFSALEQCAPHSFNPKKTPEQKSAN